VTHNTVVSRRPHLVPGPLLAALLSVLVGVAPAHAGGVAVALGNSAVIVAPGASFDLDVLVTDSNAPFNGFDAVVTYDPAALTFVPATPVSLQQGCLMTGVCSGACGTTFHSFSAAGDSLKISDVLLCDQTQVTGPGQVYRLHFVASPTQQTTHVRFRRAGFYDAGIRITPVTTTDADVIISDGVGVGDAPAVAALTLRASPEPARGPVRFAVAAPASGSQTLELHDIAGRRVRLLSSGWQPAGGHTVTWDGRDDAGLPLPPGIYLATLRSGATIARTRVTLLR
jgi:hypothetical protein